MKSLWSSFIQQKGVVVLDGGLATELEAAGQVLDDALWSARLLRDAPEAIAQVHRLYLEAGADIIITATYQATLEGFVEAGVTKAEAYRLIMLAVNLAVEARDAWFATRGTASAVKPLVAASVGPYGAYLADGSEYRGDYGLSVAALKAFHAERWGMLASSSAEILACETLPSLDEAEALLQLLHSTPERQAWFSFSCRSAKEISDGTPISACAKLLDNEPQVAAIGINCTRPQFVTALVKQLRDTSDKPIIVYPNSGELWDAEAKCWIEGSAESIDAYVAHMQAWYQAGATLIGGCCRTGPLHISRVVHATGKTYLR